MEEIVFTRPKVFHLQLPLRKLECFSNNNIWSHFYFYQRFLTVGSCRPVVQGLTEELSSWQTSEKMQLQQVLLFSIVAHF